MATRALLILKMSDERAWITSYLHNGSPEDNVPTLLAHYTDIEPAMQLCGMGYVSGIRDNISDTKNDSRNNWEHKEHLQWGEVADEISDVGAEWIYVFSQDTEIWTYGPAYYPEFRKPISQLHMSRYIDW